ncbi:MAG: hypothetical protein F4X09_09055 [Gammaproteobacteria bacterium]|nr:hypothetical protein [Gammaproteobacteria bacterium]MYC60323.1 hypothetical protein [Gammaproteobacteria bacterium]MYG96215.1 hypothetical protein [Gammaproteobacteria bacterium]
MAVPKLSIRRMTLVIAALLAAASSVYEAAAQSTYVLATGRRLPYLYAISFGDAVAPENDNTSNAILSRGKVALDRLDGQLLGDPANLVVSEDGGTVYVVNHHGAIDNAEFRQHGGRGQIAVLDVDAVLDPANDGTANALQRHLDSGAFGAVGVALWQDMLIIANAENNLTEDGGNRITFVDRRTGSLRGTVELALGSPGFACEDYPVPYVSPYGPPRNLAVLSPDPTWGCFPNPNGLALGLAGDGNAFVFTANGGTNDVSVVDLSLILEGNRLAEVGRIPAQVGPWGITATPDGRHIIVANGRSQQEDRTGNAISIIDVDRASEGADNAEVARIVTGTDDPAEQTHPFIPSVTPDGREIVVPNYRANNVSIVNLELALAGDPDAEVARIPLVREDGQPARPKGSAITSDGRFAVISGGAVTQPYSQESGHIYVIDLQSRSVVGTVTGVGNDPYNLALVER